MIKMEMKCDQCGQSYDYDAYPQMVHLSDTPIEGSRIRIGHGPAGWNWTPLGSVQCPTCSKPQGLDH